jgi:hypothetical protein
MAVVDDNRQETSVMKFRCPGEVNWVVAEGGLHLIHIRKGDRLTLAYPQAAVWDLISRGYTVERTATMVAMIAGLEETSARKLVRECLDNWVQLGFLVGS